MDFNHWIKTYNNSPQGSKTEKDALDKMAELASSFDEWRNVFYRAPFASVLERMAFLQMATRAKTFGQWLNVYQATPEGDNIEQIALAQLMKLADDPADAVEWASKPMRLNLPRWLKIAATVPIESDAEALAIQKILKEFKARKEKERIPDNSLKI